MSCQQLYIEQKIQIILYTANICMSGLTTKMSLERKGGHPPKMTVFGGGGGMRKNED